MSDGVKGVVADTIKDVHEAVVKPVVDEVGKAIEEGAQSIVGSNKPLDPVAQQKKQEEEQKRKQWAEKTIDWYKKIDQDQAKVRAENLQKQQAKQAEENQQKQVKQYSVLEQQKKSANITAVQAAARKTEQRRGVGG